MYEAKFEGPMRGRALNIVKGFLPTLQADYSFDDLIQESWFVFDKCSRRYTGVVDNDRWFGKLFDTALRRKFICLTRKVRNLEAYNPHTAGGELGLSGLVDLFRSLKEADKASLLSLAEDPEILDARSKKELLRNIKTLLKEKDEMAATKKVSKTPVKKAPAVTKSAAPKAKAKAQEVKKTPTTKPAKEKKDSVEKSLLVATGEDPRGEGEELQEYVDRIAEKVSEMEDGDFNKLPAAAKKWYEAAQEASEKGQAIPSFVVEGKAGKQPKEKAPRAAKGELRETSGTFKAIKYVVDNPNKSLDEVLKEASKEGVDLAGSRMRHVFALTRAVLSLVA